MTTKLDLHVVRLKGRNYKWPIPWAAVEALAYDEGCELDSYQCIAGVWSIGWAETEGIEPGMSWTEDQADARFYQQVVAFTNKLLAMLTVPPDENQLGAMVRFAYNIGLGSPDDTKRKRGFWWSSVRRLHNEGDYIGATRAFVLQNQFRNPRTKQLEESEVLTARRASESAMYAKAVPGAPIPSMPQAVEPESKMTASPINKGGAVTVGTGAIAAASALAEEFQGVSDVAGKFHDIASKVADWIGVPPLVLFGGLLVIVGWIIIKNRNRQRHGGWA